MTWQNPKLADDKTQIKRHAAILSGTYGVIVFLFALGIPIFNLIMGFVVLIPLAVAVFTKSANIAVDLCWLILGTVLCLVGMLVYPIAPMFNYMSTGSAIFVRVVIRGIVFWWIVQGKLGHLFLDKEALAKL